MNDPREVVADPAATYYGIAVSERSLVPADGAMVGEIRLDDWLREATAVPATRRERWPRSDRRIARSPTTVKEKERQR